MFWRFQNSSHINPVFRRASVPVTTGAIMPAKIYMPHSPLSSHSSPVDSPPFGILVQGAWVNGVMKPGQADYSSNGPNKIHSQIEIVGIRWRAWPGDVVNVGEERVLRLSERPGETVQPVVPVHPRSAPTRKRIGSEPQGRPSVPATATCADKIPTLSIWTTFGSHSPN